MCAQTLFNYNRLHLQNNANTNEPGYAWLRGRAFESSSLAGFGRHWFTAGSGSGCEICRPCLFCGNSWFGCLTRASTGHDRKCPFLGKIVIACQVRPCVPIECASQLSVFACRFECPFRCAQLTHLRWSSGRSVMSSSFGACRRNGNATMPTRASPLQIRCGDTTFQKLHLCVFFQSLDVAFAPPFQVR